MPITAGVTMQVHKHLAAVADSPGKRHPKVKVLILETRVCAHSSYCLPTYGSEIIGVVWVGASCRISCGWQRQRSTSVNCLLAGEVGLFCLCIGGLMYYRCARVRVQGRTDTHPLSNVLCLVVRVRVLPHLASCIRHMILRTSYGC